MNELQDQINTLLKDELLQDITTRTTLKQVQDLIAIEKGLAFQITIDRAPLPSIGIFQQKAYIFANFEDLELIVYQNTTVRQLKRKLRENLHIPKTSWKYIWKTYCLLFQNEKLLNDYQVMSQLGIKQHSVLKFTRLSFEKGNHQKAWKH